MPRFPKAQKRPDNTPTFLLTAKSMYGEAFGPRRQAELAESMADWADLTDEERSFTQAHLQYLNLVAQAGTQRLLLQVCELLAEIEDGVSEALDEAVEAVQSQADTSGSDDAASVFEPPVTPQLPDVAPPAFELDEDFDGAGADLEDDEFIDEPDDGGEE